jgi:hypothetical protein
MIPVQDLRAEDLSSHYKAVRARLRGPAPNNVVAFPAQKSQPEPAAAEITAPGPISEPAPEPAPILPYLTSPYQALILERQPLRNILTVFCEHYGYTKAEFTADRRTHPLVSRRQMAMYLARNLTTRSLPQIARQFGRCDHSTTVHAVRKVEERLQNNPALAAELAILEHKIKNWEA